MRPQTPAELAEVMGQSGAAGRSVNLGGHFSKRTAGGPVADAGVTISTAAMNRVRQYEPRDLTISVEAGISYCELSRVLAEHHQMIPLDPPFSDSATIGGILAANTSGPRRRLYGTARDLVIGLHFATLEGKLVESGGMVVKNVAGLDMGKLMIGSYGTLAAIAVVNFKVIPKPSFERTFVSQFGTAGEALAARDAILKSPLQPAAIEVLNTAATELDKPGFILAILAGGNAASISRYERELAALGAKPVPAGEDAAFWRALCDFTPHYLEAHPDGASVRVSCTLKELNTVLDAAPGPVIARAGSGVCYVYFEQPEEAAAFAAANAREGRPAVVEYAPENRKQDLDLWPAPGQDLEIMRRIKHMFDPRQLLNRGRLYGHI
ncbi:MAG: FAD-binding oxidoreductase [Bryobacteraceae bacterium]